MSKIYFIGIGGISMSGLAKILKASGHEVLGSDRVLSDQTKDLFDSGIRVIFGHNENNITKDIDLVVYTAAIHNDNPELKKAKELNLKIFTRAQLLGFIMDGYEKSITVSGTHGKTTTTSMISLILMEYSDPTVTIGGVLPALNSNVRIGNSDFFVAESCEYTNSFYSFFPKYSIILNIEEDHPDFFKNLDDVRHSFKHFAKNTKPGGVIFINSDIDNYEEIARVSDVSLFTFGLNEKSDLTAKNILHRDGKIEFDAVYKDKVIGNFTISIPGIHNVVNALGAISLCVELGIPTECIKRGLSKFTGAHRRFEYKGTYNGARIYDDYAHHPTEVASCIAAAREYDPLRLVLLFQPHTYSRTKILFDDFCKSLSTADTIVLTEIYAAREKNINNISSESIANKLKNDGFDAYFIKEKEDAAKFLKKNLVHGDLLIIMGAGDIYSVADLILKE